MILETNGRIVGGRRQKFSSFAPAMRLARLPARGVSNASTRREPVANQNWPVSRVVATRRSLTVPAGIGRAGWDA